MSNTQDVKDYMEKQTQAIKEKLIGLEERISVLEQGITIGLKEMADQVRSMSGKIDKLEIHQGTANAHLENLVRETSKTSQILEKDLEMKKKKMEEEHLDKQERLKTRNKIADELWQTFKQPVANAITLLITALAVYIAWHWLDYKAPQVQHHVSPQVIPQGAPLPN